MSLRLPELYLWICAPTISLWFKSFGSIIAAKCEILFIKLVKIFKNKFTAISNYDQNSQ